MDGCLVLIYGIAFLVAMLILKIPLWLTFILASILTSLFIGGPSFLVDNIYSTSTDPATIDLVLIMYLIAVFVSLYRKTGFIDQLSRELVHALKKPLIIIAFVPAILGLLPVPGGALMSIPIIDRVGDYIGLDKNRKLFLNVWFRHVIFVVYPLSTVLVLTSTLAGVNIWVLIMGQIPIALAMIIIGYFIGLYIGGYQRRYELISGNTNKKLLLKVFSPIIISIAIALSTSYYLDYKYPLPVNRVSMILGVLIGTALLAKLSGIQLRDLGKVLIAEKPLELALVGYGAMLLRGAFTSSDLSCVIDYIPSSVPVHAIAIGLPIIFSLVSGVPTGGIALSIPIIQQITVITPALASLIYISAFIGYLGSPLHLCYIYTAQYLGISITKGYKYMIPSCLATIAIAYILSIIRP